MPERLYYTDSLLTEFEAGIADVRLVSRSQGQSLWQVALDRTAFYPTSGGQPHDTGTLTARSPSGATLEAPVLAVEEDQNGEIWHTTPKPLLAGTAVRGRVDLPRRREHVQQHSGQHLLSAVFYRQKGAHTVSFHLGETTSTIDLAVKECSAAELERVEDTVNEIIAEDRAVTLRTIAGAEAESLLASGALRKLPERAGDIRLVEIEGIDLNACGGTHVRSTGQIGGLLLRGTETVRQGIRVEFVCGLRAVRSARQDLAALSRAAGLLSQGRFQVPEAVERLLAENKASHKECQALREELADYHVARLIVEVPIERGLRMVRRAFEDYDAAYIKLLASRLTASAPQTCALLSFSAHEPAKVVVARSRDLDVNCGAILREALSAYGGRGGGTPELAQGEIPGTHVDALFTGLQSKFERL